MNWYSFNPQDTLYFRGAEPSNIGESHTASAIFPPPAHAIAGAVRTAVLRQNEVSFKNYGKAGFNDERIITAIGRAGEESPFSLKGPFFMIDGKLWVPCPYSWFREKEPSKNGATTRIIRSEPLKNSLIRTGSGERLRFAKGGDLESLGGNWVNIDDLFNSPSEKIIKNGREFYVMEPHTGIALDVKSRRNVRKSHIYSFTHVRLLNGVTLIFAIDAILPLDDSGVLKIGAEQRFGAYEKIKRIDLGCGSSGLYMTLSMLAGSGTPSDHVVATGKIQYLGGWDLHRQFHKPMKGFYPAGSVFDTQINKNCIEL
jgi:CRISPR-associated protein Cmr3